ncbi:MAG TPA: hypothetical protein VG826_14425 [Pirellulales bacterium]|nr:hypothetical protein [Pirellulales bacterium]
MKRWIFLVAALFLTAADSRTSCADESRVFAPKDAKFLLRLDLQAFRTTALGNKLIEIARSKAEQELSAGAEQGGRPNLEKIHEMLGFDPFAEIRTVLVSASSYDRPEQSILVSIGMGKSTGNLEGLILALPGYAMEEYGKYTVHSAAPDNDMHVFGAIHTDARGDKTVLLAAERDSITRILDQLDRKPPGDGSFESLKLASDEKPILALEVFELPSEMLQDDHLAGAAKVVRSISLRITESKDNVNVGISLAAGTEQQAEQLRQMAQGLIAMIEFAQSTNPDDEDLKKVQKVVHDTKVSRDGSSVKANLTVPVIYLSKMIEEEVGDH